MSGAVQAAMAAMEYDRERREAAAKHHKAELARKRREKERKDAVATAEAERRIEKFDGEVAKSLPAEETRSVKDIREEYARMNTQASLIASKERILTDETRLRVEEQLREAKKELKRLEAAQDAARKKVGWWQRLLGNQEEDVGVRSFDAALDAAERDVKYLTQQVRHDDELLANPIKEVERLKRETLAGNAAALAEKYPWLKRNNLGT